MIEATIKFHAAPVKYIPALGIGALTPFFDSFQKWGAKEKTFKPRLVGEARISENSVVLDLGCGTGTLTILAKKSQPLAKVTGIDIDRNILKIAERKAQNAQADIKFDLGTAFNLPYTDKSFDRVISSLVFHHLTRESKLRALREVHRVLKNNGEVHIADLGKPQNIVMQLPSIIMRRLEETEDNVKGLIPQMLIAAGFTKVTETLRLMTLFGTISLYQGVKPADST